MLTRRDFVHAGCGIAAATLLSRPAGAILHRGSVNNSRVTINVSDIAYANFIKGFGFVPIPGNQDANGYPTSTPGSNMLTNPSMPPGYFDNQVLKFAGTGAMQLTAAPPIIVSSGGTAIFEINAASGDAGPQNLNICTQGLAAITAPRIVFAFGWNIQSISNNGSGLIRINTKTNFVASGSGYTIQSGLDQNGHVGQLVKVVGANGNTGANGIWAITNVSASSFDLVGSTFTNAQAGAAGTATFAASNMSVSIVNRATFAGFSALVWCRAAEESAVDAGQLIANDYITQLQYVTNPGSSLSARAWLRFMDFTGVQSSLESDFDERIPSTFISYPIAGIFRPDYYVGAIARGTNDAYTCSNPTHSAAGAYVDQEIVQGTPSATNTAGLPTLAITGRPGGAKPIYSWFDGMPPFILGLTGGTPTPGTDVMKYTFSATWFNGGTPYVFTYNTTVSGPFGSDAVLGNLMANLTTALLADTTLAAGLIFFLDNNNGVVNDGPRVYPRTTLAGAMTITYTSGPAISIIEHVRPSEIDNTQGGTFVFNSLLDGWIYRPGGMLMAGPLEVAVEMCNRSGNHLWWNWPITKGSYITAVTQFFGDAVTGLTSGLRFGAEVGNEIWNSGAFPYTQYTGLGMLFGWSPSSFVANFSYAGLRTAQYAQLSKTAWTGKGRAASDHYVFSMHQLGEGANNNFDTSHMKGTSLGNSICTTYGGLNGSGATSVNYSVAPNRPVDFTTAVGQAPYWGSKWFGNNSSFTDASTINGTAGQNAPWMQAAKDYANGLTTTAFTSLVNQFTGVTGGAPNSVADFTTRQSDFTANEAMVAQYDGSRPSGMTKLAVMDYEGGPSFGIGNNGNSGVNSLNNQLPNILSADITALANRMTALGWNVSTWTLSATDNKTEMAQMTLEMLQGWKFDTTTSGAAANTGSYDTMIKTWYYQAMKTTSATREAKPAQYGISGNNWGWQPSSILGNTPYQNYNALHEWNAG